MTTVALLTPTGTGAIAVLELAGPDAWPAARKLFRPVGKPLPESPILHHTWFGTLGDEVLLSVKQIEPEIVLEIQCHGGLQVVKRLFADFSREGIHVQPSGQRPCESLAHARTVRTAAILLDQANGAFDRAFCDPRNLPRLAELAPVGRHLVEPWKVVIAGAPNAGKSSLVNAIAGYQRSIVSPVAGTTRDIVTTLVALDGWPVELADTAGLREAAESLEAAGVEQARRFLEHADLVVWLLDGTDPHPVWPERGDPLIAVNKSDCRLAFDLPAGVMSISAATGYGIDGLIAAIVRRLVPVDPLPGEAVAYTPELADRVLARLAESGLPATPGGS